MSGGMVLSVAATTDVGVVRANNEDNFYCNGVFREDITEKRLSYHDTVKVVKTPRIFSVMDGMGGLKAGEIASLVAAKELARLCSADPSCDMLAFLMKMNERVCKAGRDRSARIGSTAVMACVGPDGVQFANIGDSRGFLLHGGELVRRSVDHSERGSLERMREGLGYDDGLGGGLPGNMHDGLTQYLGIEADELIIEPEIGEEEPFEVGDVILLSSDGLTGVVEEEIIREELMKGDDLRIMADRLIGLAIEHGSSDNITVALIRRER